MTVKSRLEADLKEALKARDTARVSTLRMAIAAVKQREIDAGRREGLPDTETVSVLERMIKQRRESVAQYRAAGREDNALAEEAETRLLATYLPEPLDTRAIDAEIHNVIREMNASNRRDMGKVMGILKARLAGRADMAEVSRRVRDQLPD